MTATAPLTDATGPSLVLGLPGFTLEDLYAPAGLQRLHAAFSAQLSSAEPALHQAWCAYVAAGGQGLAPTAESELLVRLATHVSAFVQRLFRIEAEAQALAQALTGELPVSEFKREFVSRRVYKKGAPDRPTAAEFPSLDARARLLFQLGFGSDGVADDEAGLAHAVLRLLECERALAAPSAENAPARARWTSLRDALLASQEGREAFGSTLVPHGPDAEELKAVRGLVSLLDRWTFARALHPEGRRALAHWSSHRLPQPLVPERLVELKLPDASLPEALEGPDHHLRARDGFKLTDRRAGPREVMDQVDYCILCHERDKDSCSKGFPSKDPAADGGPWKRNALGTPLTGCPLDERIGEAHALKRQGDSLGALALVTRDNPMCPGTGHRICNDCMKACVYQKQQPVDIPQLETASLTDVLRLPWGFEIYGLLTRWNPLNPRRPVARPYIGKNVLVVGMGPAGYTLAHYLLNEGFGVVGIDGLKVEPFPDGLTGRNGAPLRPIRDYFSEVAEELDERILGGFGGVSEYGITVRWDKSFLSLIHLTLARRSSFALYGGVRFGGTLTLEDAWELGFDHVALAAGAGRPTLVGMKNNLLRGIRQASDFLMGLQLSGAFKKDSLASLQVQLPALVIGGGLTGVDTATELLAYYPVQVEKVLHRHERLCQARGEAAVLAALTPEERATYDTFLAHGRAIRAEREKAASEGRAPNFLPLLRSWGGVALCYRRGLTDSPAYRLNHEEVAKALEEGIRIIEHVSPVEALADGHGAVRALRFERTKAGGFYELPAKTVCVAAGTSPNVTYERELPGTFQLDARGSYFRAFNAVEDGAGHALEPASGGEPAFFTSYNRGGRLVSFYGDNHPAYAGNVVKAMASAKDGHVHVSRLFDRHVASLQLQDAEAQARRDAQLSNLFSRLDAELRATVVSVKRLAPNISEVVLRAPAAARKFQPGQFYRLQNYERTAQVVDGTRLCMEGLALTGAWVDRDKGLLGAVVLEMGTSSRLSALLRPGEPVVCMGPTGAPTDIPSGETVLLAGGGLGNAVLFSIGRAMRAAGCRVVYFAGYRKAEDSYKHDDIEAAADQVIWAVDGGTSIPPRRPSDCSFRGNIVQAMVAWARGELPVAPLCAAGEVQRIIAIGSDRMMKAVKEARHGVLQPYLRPGHEALGSINSPMQCMMKEICAQCLQRHVDPATGKELFVFSCMNQDQPLDRVDFAHLDSRLRANSVLEKQSNLYLDELLARLPAPPVL